MTVAFVVQIKIPVDLRKHLADLKRKGRNITRRGMNMAGRMMRDDLRAVLPKRTGALSKSIAPSTSVKYDVITVRTGPRKGYTGKKGGQPNRYVAAVDRGRKAVEVQKKKVLSDGGKFFGRKVAAFRGHGDFERLQTTRGPAYAAAVLARIRADYAKEVKK